MGTFKDPTPAELDRVKKLAWDKYLPKYHEEGEQGRRTWQENYDKALDAYTKDHLDPLGRAHVEWLKSPRMQVYMAHSFEVGHPNSGSAYTATLHACVRGTAGLQACFDYYVDALKAADAQDSKNIVIRALAFNHDEVAGAAKSASEIDKRVIPWDSVYGVYQAAVGRMLKGEADEAAKLMVELGGPIAKVLRGVIDGSARVVIMGLVSLHAGKPWARVELVGTYERFRELTVRRILSLNPELSGGEVKRAVAAEIKRMRIRGELPNTRMTQPWLLMLDPDQIKGLPPSGTTEEKLAWLKGKMVTPEQLHELQTAARLNSFKRVMSTDVRMGAATGILQMVCFTKLLSDMQNAMVADKEEARDRLVAGIFAITGTISQMSASVMERLPPYYSALSVGRTWTPVVRYLGIAGKALGFAGGVIMAGWDGYKAWQEMNKGNSGVAILYVGSSILGFAVAIGFICGWNPFLLALLVVCLVIVGVLLEIYKDNKLQSWVEQCIFGKSARYSSADLEMRELELALR